MINTARSPKSAFLPANCITVEYSSDAGKTWEDYGLSEAQKRDLFALTCDTYVGLSKSSPVSTNDCVRITIEPLDRYVSFDQLYIWFSIGSHTCTLDLERSTIGAKDTFSFIRKDVPLNGWSGPNVINFPYGTFGGGVSQTGNNYKYRMTFRTTKLGNSTTQSPTINDIRFYGDNAWAIPNDMVKGDYPFSWDRDMNVNFSKQLKEQGKRVYSDNNKPTPAAIGAATAEQGIKADAALPKSGGTMTGFITLHAAPTANMHPATKKYVDDKMIAAGNGDMTKAVYDPGGRELPYIPKQDVDALAWGGDFGASGTPVSIAYAGAQRIASITAYGETPQGGTTEAPVALTGISSVTVNDDVTELPIPRPLHKVGDVRDVCRTRVKSVYDKRIVLDGTENWHNMSSLKPNSFLIPVSERIVNGLSDSYPTLKSPEIGTKNGIYLSYTMDIIVTDLACSTVEEFKAHLSAHPLTVYYRSTAYDGTNGLDVCLTEYQTGFAELDGKNVQASYYPNNGLPYGLFVTRNIIKTNDGVVCSQAKTEPANLNWGYVYAANVPLTDIIFGLIGSDITSGTELNAYLAAQNAAGTPVQIAYQLATPEVYATDPVDCDNTAGPLTVLTGGELEVRMTELVGSRSPEIVAKMDKATYDADGDGVVDAAAAVPWSGVTGKPNTFPPSTHKHTKSEITDFPVSLKNPAALAISLNGTSQGTYDGSVAKSVNITPAGIGALGRTEKAADSSKLAGLTPVVDNPGPSNRNNKDGTRKYYAALYADHATTSGRANNLSMGLNGSDLWVYYS